MRGRLLPLLGLLALAVVVALGISQAGGGKATQQKAAPRFDLETAKRELAGAPAPLAALHRDANELIAATPASFRARLRDLRGHPVVINKWASWCGPCRSEFPFYQRQGTERGKQVAFVGVNSEDSRGTAATFLRETPAPFPSFEDPKGRIADSLARTAFPATIFLDERGRTAFVHQGQYRSEADLAADIDRYLSPQS